MRKGALSEYLELESVEFQDQYIVGGQSRSSHSWFRLYDEILSFCRHRRQRLVFLAISLVTLVVLVTISSSKNDEETPNVYNALHLFEERKEVGGCNHHCCGGGQTDPANKPFERRVDRSYCENDYDIDEWEEDIHNSEILRCYNATYRYCIPDIDTDVPDNDVDKGHYWYADCAYEFFEDDGLLYSASGSLMPESFKSKCDQTSQWRYVYYLTPENGCGADVPLRFCNCNGTIDMDFLTGDGPFNWKEFEIADLYKMGSEDDHELEEDCKRERQKRCP